MLRRVVLPLMVVIGAACDEAAPTEPGGKSFEIAVQTGNGLEKFRVRIEDPAQVAEAERLLDTGENRNISGSLARGDGGFNEPYGWHLVASTVHFADLTIEVCDGSPSDIDKDLDYWVDTVKQYCPWGVSVSRKIQD